MKKTFFLLFLSIFCFFCDVQALTEKELIEKHKIWRFSAAATLLLGVAGSVFWKKDPNFSKILGSGVLFMTTATLELLPKRLKSWIPETMIGIPAFLALLPIMSAQRKIQIYGN